MKRKVIDLSVWQEGIDFKDIKLEGVEGVIIRICYGTNIDETWWYYVSECNHYNIPWGVYVYSYAETPEEAEQEANEVAYLLTMEQYEPQLGIWFDCEDDVCFAEGVDTTALCRAFVDKMKYLGYDNVGIYTSDLKCTKYMTNSIQPNLLDDTIPFWIANYSGYPIFPSGYPTKTMVGWQYSCSGFIGGRTVDKNVWYV